MLDGAVEESIGEDCACRAATRVEDATPAVACFETKIGVEVASVSMYSGLAYTTEVNSATSAKFRSAWIPPCVAHAPIVTRILDCWRTSRMCLHWPRQRNPSQVHSRWPPRPKVTR